MLLHDTAMRIKDVWGQKGIPRSDAEILLSVLLQRDRSWIFAHSEVEIPSQHVVTLEAWIRRRKDDEPVAYILRQQEFFGRMFTVDARVLIPRPSTEGLVELALEVADGTFQGDVLRTIDTGIVAYGQRWGEDTVTTMSDVGTGSGCIAVTLACERPSMHMIASDVSEDALHVARENAETHQVSAQIEFKKGFLLEPLQNQKNPFILVSNIPYVPDQYDVPHAVLYEPRNALFGGEDGTDFLLPMVGAARQNPACVGFVVECREDQVAAITRRA